MQKRGGDVLKCRKSSAVMSGVYAIRDHLRHWYLGTPADDWDSMGVLSDGSLFGIPKGLFFSMPVRCSSFNYEVLNDIEISAFAREKIELNSAELEIERNEVFS